jgi:hypothetical protein
VERAPYIHARVLQWLTTWDDEARADAFAREALRFIESRRPRWNGSVTRSMLANVPVVHLELGNNAVWSSDVRNLRQYNELPCIRVAAHARGKRR